MPTLRPVADLLIEAAKLWASVIDTRRRRAASSADDVDARLVVAAMFDAVLSTTRWFTGKRPQNPDRVGDALGRPVPRRAAAT